MILRQTKPSSVDDLARFAGAASVGVGASITGLGAAAATRSLPVNAKKVDAAEAYEAFSSVTLASIADSGLSPDPVNPNGGAIALGHALGSSGTRLLTALIHELRHRGGGNGLTTPCIGGDQEMAASVEVRG